MDILKLYDFQCLSKGSGEARVIEIVGMVIRRYLEIMIREEVNDRANIMGGRFLMTIK